MKTLKAAYTCASQTYRVNAREVFMSCLLILRTHLRSAREPIPTANIITLG